MGAKTGAARESRRATRLAEALDSAGRLMKHGGVVFVVSDFWAEGYERSLRRLGRKHDVVAIRIQDPTELDPPAVGRVLVEDPESGGPQWVDLSQYRVRTELARRRLDTAQELQERFRGAQVECLEVSTEEDYGEAVVRFFRARSRGHRHHR